MHERPDVARVDQLLGRAAADGVGVEVARIGVEHRHRAAEVAAGVEVAERGAQGDQGLGRRGAERRLARQARVGDEREQGVEAGRQPRQATQHQPR